VHTNKPPHLLLVSRWQPLNPSSATSMIPFPCCSPLYDVTAPHLMLFLPRLPPYHGPLRLMRCIHRYSSLLKCFATAALVKSPIIPLNTSSPFFLSGDRPSKYKKVQPFHRAPPSNKLPLVRREVCSLSRSVWPDTQNKVPRSYGMTFFHFRRQRFTVAQSDRHR